MNDGTEPVLDSEILYRRISCQYYNPENDTCPSPLSFRLIPEDITGLSVYRAKYKTMKQVAANPREKQYYVASFLAGKLRENEIDIVPRPLQDDPGHAEIPNLTYENRKTPKSREIQLSLAEKLWKSIDGPI